MTFTLAFCLVVTFGGRGKKQAPQTWHHAAASPAAASPAAASPNDQSDVFAGHRLGDATGDALILENHIF
jgi:hypothetical protein